MPHIHRLQLRSLEIARSVSSQIQKQHLLIGLEVETPVLMKNVLESKLEESKEFPEFEIILLNQ